MLLLGTDLGISQQDVLLALGQVTSRSLASGSSGGMCPVIDLLNHQASAGAPMLQLDDRDQLTMTVLPLLHVSCALVGLYDHRDYNQHSNTVVSCPLTPISHGVRSAAAKLPQGLHSPGQSCIHCSSGSGDCGLPRTGGQWLYRSGVRTARVALLSCTHSQLDVGHVLSLWPCCLCVPASAHLPPSPLTTVSAAVDYNDLRTLILMPFALCRTPQGDAVPMSAGDELLILYKGGYTPLEAFLKFGFVAEEWWQ